MDANNYDLGNVSHDLANVSAELLSAVSRNIDILQRVQVREKDGTISELLSSIVHILWSSSCNKLVGARERRKHISNIYQRLQHAKRCTTVADHIDGLCDLLDVCILVVCSKFTAARLHTGEEDVDCFDKRKPLITLVYRDGHFWPFVDKRRMTMSAKKKGMDSDSVGKFPVYSILNPNKNETDLVSDCDSFLEDVIMEIIDVDIGISNSPLKAIPSGEEERAESCHEDEEDDEEEDIGIANSPQLKRVRGVDEQSESMVSEGLHDLGENLKNEAKRLDH